VVVLIFNVFSDLQPSLVDKGVWDEWDM
jgi:hypothetical protein